ncbi:MAG TPA: flavin reductase family protein [Nocardioides sp.]|nr:flavin reductase family protein [Nocardioides sp.]
MNAGELSALQTTFRAAMASVATPVSIVTTIELFGQPYGTTVSAFSSLSMTPPMVLVSLDAGSSLLGMIERSGSFGLNVLAADQAELALRFANKSPGRFTNTEWAEECGAARLAGAAAWVGCAVADIVDGGDHRILLGNVTSVDVTDREPLTYHARTFGTHRRHVTAC